MSIKKTSMGRRRPEIGKHTLVGYRLTPALGPTKTMRILELVFRSDKNLCKYNPILHSMNGDGRFIFKEAVTVEEWSCDKDGMREFRFSFGIIDARETTYYAVYLYNKKGEKVRFLNDHDGDTENMEIITVEAAK